MHLRIDQDLFLRSKRRDERVVTRFQNSVDGLIVSISRQRSALKNVHHKGILSNPIWANSSIMLPCTLARSARDYDRSICKLMCFASIVCHSPMNKRHRRSLIRIVIVVCEIFEKIISLNIFFWRKESQVYKLHFIRMEELIIT